MQRRIYRCGQTAAEYVDDYYAGYHRPAASFLSRRGRIPAETDDSKDVAERTGLDISTISRVSNSKYAQTNFGIYPLKFFFSDGYTTEDGEEMSVRENS